LVRDGQWGIIAMKRHAIASCTMLVILTSITIVTGTPTNEQTQASGSTKAPEKALSLPSGTAIVGRLSEKLYADRCRIGDVVEAQITRDVTEGHQTLLKRDAHVTGRIVKLNTASNATEPYGVGILFDNVTLKNGDVLSLHVEIQAIAPPQNPGLNPITDIPYSPGGAKVNANQGVVEPLSPKSQGPIGLFGVSLGFETANRTHISILSSTNGNIHLEKWSQVVFRVVNP
jgi:hypothetical protein